MMGDKHTPKKTVGLKDMTNLLPPPPLTFENLRNFWTLDMYDDIM